MASSIPIDAGSPPPPNATDANKQRLSRALGAAFLSHQVEQLESRVRSLDVKEEPGPVLYNPKVGASVTMTPVRGGGGGHGRNTSMSTSSGGRGERRREGSGGGGRGGRGRGRGRGGGGPPAGPPRQRRDSFDRSLPPRPAQPSSSPRIGTDSSLAPLPVSPSMTPDGKLVAAAATAGEYDRHRMADKIVLDASVLIHSLGTVRKWASPGRKEELIIPLEALNTIDLLKKGPSIIAIQSRAASRFLEEQVGQNARVQIQRETAFIPFDELAAAAPSSAIPDDDASAGVNQAKEESPEWVKRILCCAAYEVAAGAGAGGKKSVLALVAPTAELCFGDEHTARFESRADGIELRKWAKEMTMATLEIGKGGRGSGPAGAGVGASGEWVPRGRGGGRPRGERGGRGRGGRRGGAGRASEEEKEEEPVRVIKVLARGERLDT